LLDRVSNALWLSLGPVSCLPRRRAAINGGKIRVFGDNPPPRRRILRFAE